MARGLRTDGRSVGAEKMDSWSEVTLGLCSICLVTVVLMCFSFFVVELTVMPWVHGWESNSQQNSTVLLVTNTMKPQGAMSMKPQGAMSMQWFKGQIEKENPGGFKGWDADGDGHITEDEFFKGTKGFAPPLGHEKAALAFRYFDGCDRDAKVTQDEWSKALASSEFNELMCTTTTTEAPSSGKEREFWKRINRKHLRLVRAHCDEMDLAGLRDGHHEIAFDEFEAFVTLKYGMGAAEAKDLFDALDLNDNKRVSGEECHENLNSLKRSVDDLGSPATVVSTMDTNEDGKLDSSEFARLGDTLYMDNGDVLGKNRTKQLFYRLDVDGDGLTEEELNFSAVPPATSTQSPSGQWTTRAVGAMRTTTPLPDAFLEGNDVPPKNLTAYRHVMAVIHGRTTFELQFPKTVTLPPEGQIGPVVWPIFQSSFQQVMQTPPLKLQTMAAVRLSQASMSEIQGIPADEIPYVVQQVTISWEFDTNDGGGIQEAMRQHVPNFKQHVLMQIQSSSDKWLAAAEATMGVRITAQYFGIKSIGLPAGSGLVQHFGWDQQTALINSPIRTLPQTDASVRQLSSLIV